MVENLLPLNCGENQGGGLNAIFGSGPRPPAALAALAWGSVVKLAARLIVRTSPGIVFFDPSSCLFCLLIIKTEVGYRPLFAPTVISNVPSSQSWVCTLSDRKWRELKSCWWKKGGSRSFLKSSFGRTLLASQSRRRAIVTSGVSVAPSGTSARTTVLVPQYQYHPVSVAPSGWEKIQRHHPVEKSAED